MSLNAGLYRMTKEFQLSILLPSAYPSKLNRFMQNLQETVSDWNNIEIVICLDADDKNPAGNTIRHQNIVYTYAEPSQYRGRFFDAAWKASTGKFLLMANDDIMFKTKGWDRLIPYNKYPDEMVVFGLKDNRFNEKFFCHPIWSRKVMELEPGLFEPNFWITKCDNVIWDIHPPHRRIYLEDIEIEHNQEPYDLKKWQPAYDHDNRLYFDSANIDKRNRVLSKINHELGLDNVRLLIGTPTAEYARRADFYSHYNLISRPPGTVCVAISGQSIAQNRNLIVEQAITLGSTHVMFIDDDVICKPDIIYKLLEHRKEIVTALQLKRNFPHFPLIFDERVNETEANHFQLKELDSGLKRIYSAGLGCVLIDINVFRNMEKPWFRLGEFKPDQMSEDTGFFKRADLAGVVSYVDLDCTVGHIASMVVRPVKRNGTWTVDYDTNGSGSIAFAPPYVDRLELAGVK